MKTIQASAFEGLTRLLQESLEEGNEHAIRAELMRFTAQLRVAERREDFLPYLFAAALMKRLDPAASDQMNLYLKQFDVPQITLFNLLAEKFPLMNGVTAAANALLSRFVRPGEPLRFLEIGIGTGRQIVMLLNQLAEQGRLPASLVLHAVEPNDCTLREAEHHLKEAAGRLGLPLEFHAHPAEIERLPDQVWAAVENGPGRLLVNASFALHHIRDHEPGRSAKDAILHRIRRLQPAVLVLCEPDSDHHTSDAVQRFVSCWNHFQAVFRFIDSLPLQPEESRALKSFFGREIEDIIAGRESLRCERHESTDSWKARLRQAGFIPGAAAEAAPHLKPHPEMTVSAGSWHLGFGHSGINLVSVICTM